jgi:hypothetical protein
MHKSLLTALIFLASLTKASSELLHLVKAQSEANSAALAKASSELLQLVKTGVRQLTVELNTVDNDRIFFWVEAKGGLGNQLGG